MKRSLVLLLLVMLAMPLVPGAEGAHAASGGAQAVIVDDWSPGTGTGVMDIRWRVSPDDPNQATGDWDYNITYSPDGGTTWVDFGEASTISFLGEYNEEDGILGGLLTFSDNFPDVQYNITVYDGTHTTDGCLITISHNVEGDHDACGDLDLTYNQLECLERPGASTSGFDEEQHISIDDPNLVFTEKGVFGDAVGGKELGDDTNMLEWEFSIDAAIDGGQSGVRFLFSSLDNPVTTDSWGNLATTGVFAEGVSVEFIETGNDWLLRVYEHRGGTITKHFEETLTDGVDANEPTTGTFRVDGFSGFIIVTLGNEKYAVSETEFTNGFPEVFYTFYAAEYNAKTFMDRSGTNLCWNTADPDFGGGQAQFGSASGQPLEDFDGEGGLGGPPMFPFVDFQTTSDKVGIDVTPLAWIFAVATIAITGGIGLVRAGPVGAGYGVLLGVVLTAIWNLLAYWWIIAFAFVGISLILREDK